MLYRGRGRGVPRAVPRAVPQVVAQLKKEHSLPLTYIALDWHEMDKQLGHDGIVEVGAAARPGGLARGPGACLTGPD